MKILYFEDQEEKYKHVREVLIETRASLTWKKDCQSGLMELLETSYDYVLLDMSMPICEDGITKDNFESFAGMSVLREIKRKKYNTKVIVITGFNDFEKGTELITLKELIDEIGEKYPQYYYGYVKYDSTSVEWQEHLKKLLRVK